jgi:hypothetical protein
MKRFGILAAVLAIGAVGCGKSSNEPSNNPPVKPTFTATLSPANEVPPVTNAEASGSGNVTITLDVTKDAAGNITAATANFTVNVSGFPQGTSFTAMHIHEGAPTCACPVVVNAGLTAAEGFGASGSASITKNSVAVNPVEVAQRLINNPAGFYFNIHTTLNGGGAARGTLVKTAG